MAESGLSIARTELRQIIARQFGYSLDSADWSEREVFDIDQAYKSALRLVYVPPIGRTYMWSFMRPLTTLDMTAGVEDYQLPDDFGAIEGEFTYPPTTMYPAVTIRGEGAIRRARQVDQQRSRPLLAAVIPLASDGTTGQRWRVMFWPKPDDAYTVTYRYTVQPQAMTDEAPYPLGGATHAELFKAACMATAEEHRDGMRGSLWSAFLDGIEGNMNRDRASIEPTMLGTMAPTERASAYMRHQQYTRQAVDYIHDP